MVKTYFIIIGIFIALILLVLGIIIFQEKLIAFPDYGKICNDSSQCLGNCEPPQEYLEVEDNEWVVPYREGVYGTCTEYKHDCESHQIINGTLNLTDQFICVV